MSAPAIACFWKDWHDSFVKEYDSDCSSKCKQEYPHDTRPTFPRSHPRTSGDPGHHEKCPFVHFHGIAHDTTLPHILFAMLAPWVQIYKKCRCRSIILFTMQDVTPVFFWRYLPVCLQTNMITQTTPQSSGWKSDPFATENIPSSLYGFCQVQIFLRIPGTLQDYTPKPQRVHYR